MLTSRVRNQLALRINEGLFYGWVILAVGAIGIFASGPAQSHTFSVFISLIVEDLGVSHISVSLIYAIATLVASLFLAYVGKAMDRYGVSTVFLCVSVLFGLSVIAFGHVTNILMLGLAFVVLRFLGQGSLMLCCNNMVAHWFDRKRGLAMGLMGLGWAATIAIHPPFAQWLIEQVGWRDAWLWLGLTTWLILLTLALGFVHAKPEDLGLNPDGVVPDTDPGTANNSQDTANVGLSLRQALGTVSFWIIALALASFSMLVTGMFFHQVLVFKAQGLDVHTATRVFSISAMAMVASMPVLGRMLDRFSPQRVFAGALLTMSAALLSMAFVYNMTTAVVYSVLFGITNASIHTHANFFWPLFFGRKHLGSIQGAGQTIVLVAASLGPLPLAIAYDKYQSHTGILMLLSVLPMVCAVLVLLMKPPDLSE